MKKAIARAAAHLLLLSLAAGSYTAALAADIRIALPGGGALVLPAPDGWSGTVEVGAVPTLTLGPKGGKAFQVLVSPLVRRDGSTALADDAALRRLTERGMSEAKAQAMEPQLQMQTLQSADVQGFYFTATDRAPEADGYKHLTQGAANVKGLPFSFTILSNGAAEAVRQPALAMLKAARREP